MYKSRSVIYYNAMSRCSPQIAGHGAVSSALRGRVGSGRDQVLFVLERDVSFGVLNCVVDAAVACIAS